MFFKHKYTTLLWTVFLPTAGMTIGLVYSWDTHRSPNVMYMLFSPVVVAAIITFAGHMLTQTPFNNKTGFLAGIPAGVLYFLVTWAIPFRSQYPGSGIAIEYIGFGLIDLCIVVIPIVLGSIISIALSAWSGFRIREMIDRKRL